MHSANHQGSGSVIILRDPSTGMAVNLSFAPGQMTKTVQVEMNGRTYVAKAELRQLPGSPPNGEDLAFGLIVNNLFEYGGADTTRPMKAAPHPATVLTSKEETAAAKEALRLKREEDEERAARGEDKPNYQMTDAELSATHAALDARKREKDSFDAKPGLPSVEDGEVDPNVVDTFVMSEKEVADMKEEAKPKAEVEVSEEVELVEDAAAEEPAQEPAEEAASASTTESTGRRNRRNNR